MAQSYKKGRKFKTESPALLSITRGGRPAAAPRLLPAAYRLCALAIIPVSGPAIAARLWIVVGVRFLCRGKRGRAGPFTSTTIAEWMWMPFCRSTPVSSHQT